MLHGSGLLLLSSVAGYWVLERASSHKGQLKSVGQLIGWVVIVTSLVGLTCRIWSLATGKAFCPIGGKGGYFCPLTGKSMPESPK
ncbi:MAG: hypothetical protein A3B73_01290 [Omnitrophica WOR_2 bacterium RIFCSPHIGHO2_02_FULL_63_39]|nr:MAG: hypothetical protein A2Z92_01640 [Omnitrophica WOR_2 bacterium GWA2_63_20]OGX36126.1 MAG: hypothetical protein A3B73_01290 [Omnitrophica WOR_2 bacterium RIFCSPHIGHO2_02_FULL_63_39]HBQ38409.1 hypothetical protein [Candidatus Omnitrophota bacterium]